MTLIELVILILYIFLSVKVSHLLAPLIGGLLCWPIGFIFVFGVFFTFGKFLKGKR